MYLALIVIAVVLGEPVQNGTSSALETTNNAENQQTKTRHRREAEYNMETSTKIMRGIGIVMSDAESPVVAEMVPVQLDLMFSYPSAELATRQCPDELNMDTLGDKLLNINVHYKNMRE